MKLKIKKSRIPCYIDSERKTLFSCSQHPFNIPDYQILTWLESHSPHNNYLCYLTKVGVGATLLWRGLGVCYRNLLHKLSAGTKVKRSIGLSPFTLSFEPCAEERGEGQNSLVSVVWKAMSTVHVALVSDMVTHADQTTRTPPPPPSHFPRLKELATQAASGKLDNIQRPHAFAKKYDRFTACQKKKTNIQRKCDMIWHVNIGCCYTAQFFCTTCLTILLRHRLQENFYNLDCRLSLLYLLVYLPQWQGGAWDRGWTVQFVAASASGSKIKFYFFATIWTAPSKTF